MTTTSNFTNSVDLIFPATGHAIPLDHAYAQLAHAAGPGSITPTLFLAAARKQLAALAIAAEPALQLTQPRRRVTASASHLRPISYVAQWATTKPTPAPS
jgi:hypothetical protein